MLTDGDESDSTLFDNQQVKKLLTDLPSQDVHVTIVSVGGSVEGVDLLTGLAKGLKHVDVVGKDAAAGNIAREFKTFSTRVMAMSRLARMM